MNGPDEIGHDHILQHDARQTEHGTVSAAAVEDDVRDSDSMVSVWPVLLDSGEASVELATVVSHIAQRGCGFDQRAVLDRLSRHLPHVTTSML